MPSAQDVYSNFNAASVTLTSTTEAVVATARAINTPFLGAVVAVTFAVELAAGSDQTSIVAKIRRDSLTGTAILTSSSLTTVVSGIIMLNFGVVDQQAVDVAGQVYVLTLKQAGGTGNGAVINRFSQVVVG